VVCIEAGVSGDAGTRVIGVAGWEWGCRNESACAGAFLQGQSMMPSQIQGQLWHESVQFDWFARGKMKRMANRSSIASHRLAIAVARQSSRALKTEQAFFKSSVLWGCWCGVSLG